MGTGASKQTAPDRACFMQHSSSRVKAPVDASLMRKSSPAKHSHRGTSSTRAMTVTNAPHVLTRQAHPHLQKFKQLISPMSYAGFRAKKEQDSSNMGIMARALDKMYHIAPKDGSRRMSMVSMMSNDASMDGATLAHINPEALDAAIQLRASIEALRAQLKDTEQHLSTMNIDLKDKRAVAMLTPLHDAINSERELLYATIRSADQNELDDLAEQVLSRTRTMEEILQQDTQNNLHHATTMSDEGNTTQTMLAAENRRRADVTVNLVKAIHEDLGRYEEQYNKVKQNPHEDAALTELELLLRAVPQALEGSDAPLDTAAAEKLVAGWTPGQPVPSRTLHTTTTMPRLEKIFRRSTALREALEAIDGIDAARSLGAYLMPGGLRHLEKDMYEHNVTGNCDFSRCNDVVRCTVVANSLVVATGIVAAMLDSSSVVVVRAQNRFARGCDTRSTGGYRDCCLLLVFRYENQWLFGEVTICLAQMAMIAAREDGLNVTDGLTITDFEQTLASIVDPLSSTHVGLWEPDLCLRIASGALQVVDIRQGLTTEQTLKLAAALTSASCRVLKLILWECELGAQGAVAIAKTLTVNHTIRHVDLSYNSFGPEGGKAIAEALRFNQGVTYLDLSWNQLGTDGGTALAIGLWKNRVLRQIKLQDNALTEKVRRMFKKAYGHFERPNGKLLF
eukprot:m.106288 g.106288  ORF g.106288 m.106288 type:complete len:679 (+) comp10579_c0_seq1:60-2096(+)